MAIGIFKKTLVGLDNQPISKAQQRASRLDTPSLYTWMDTTIMSLGSSFDGWRYKSSPSSEVRDCIEALQVIWAELESRTTK
jgi:hypothetical protein